jgi:hypothetical protein
MSKLQTQIHPDEVLEALKATCGNKRSKNNLDILHAVCRRQKEGNSTDFTLPTIGELSSKANGPGYTSIRTQDKSGQRFQQLITAWANYSGGVTTQSKRESQQENKPPTLAEQLQKTGVDAALVALVGRLEVEHRRAVNAVNLAKSQSEVVIDRRRAALPAAPSATPLVLPATTLTDMEREALQAALSEDFLADQGWTVDKSGRIKNDKKRTIFQAGFASALRKMLDA